MEEEGRKISIKERLSAIGKRFKGKESVMDDSMLAPTEEILIQPAQPENTESGTVLLDGMSVNDIGTVLLTEDPVDPCFSVEYEITYIHTDEIVK